MCRSSRRTEESEDSLARSLSLLDKAERPCEETEVNDAVARCWDPENVFGELTTDILEEQHVKMGIHGLVFSVEQHPNSALLVSGAWRGVPQWHANGDRRDVRVHAMLSDRSYPSAWRAATGPSGGAGAGRGGSTWPLRHSLKRHTMCSSPWIIAQPLVKSRFLFHHHVQAMGSPKMVSCSSHGQN